MRLWESEPDGGRDNLNPLSFLDWRQQQRAFSDMAAFVYTDRTLAGGDGGERLRTGRVTPGLFRVFGCGRSRSALFRPQGS